MQPAPPSHRGRNLAIVLIVILALAAVSGAYLLGAFSPPNKYPWLFKGAYATYSGQSTMTGIFANTTGIATFSIQVLNFNSTHAQMQYNFSGGIGSQSSSNQTIRWVKLSPSFVEVNSTQTNSTLVRTYNTSVNISGKTINCTAYEFELFSNENSTVCISNSVGFPVEFTLLESIPFGGTFSYNLQLVRTNISGL